MKPKVAPQITTSLAQMLSKGCVISTRGLDGNWLIADAVFLSPHCLWYFLAFGTSNQDEHHLEFHRVEDDGLYLNFYSADGSILATIAPVEFREHREALAAWLAFLSTDKGRPIAASLSELKAQAVIAKGISPMNIEKAWTTKRQGYPILHLVIDGRIAHICEPKLTLLERGIVVLLDDEKYWYQNISATFQDNGKSIQVNGGTDDPAVLAIVRRFVNGEIGDLVN